VSQVREYSIGAKSTDVFGRVLCHTRDHHFIVDGPAQNGCPGEAITPVEVFLTSVAACGVELVQVIAREDGLEPPRVQVAIDGMIDRANPIRRDVTVLNQVRIRFTVTGVSREQATDIVERFKGR
jgi:uncharacterized OsmC-like protein